MGNRRSAVTESDEIDYTLPAAKLLQRGKGDPGPDMRDREAVAKALLDALRHFGVEAKLLGVVSGPHVSRYELQLAPGTKVSKVARLRDDLAYALASTDIRILAPIPGKKAVGVEVPEPAPAPGPAGRHLRRAPEGLLAARRLARQGRLRAGRLGRPGADAARARRRHHRVGQVGLHQRDALLGPAARLAERGSPGARRPEAGRAEPLRAAAAPADPGRHQSAAGRQRARQPDRRDGEPLRRHGRGPGAQPGRAQPGAVAGRARRRCRTSSA